MESQIELLSPAGDFECLKAAVQNGANCIYFGANLFSARAYANNFDDDELAKAIEYCKIRGVKTNLTLNILIKDNELESAFNVAKKAYESGIDAIIVQDLGLAKMLIKNFPDLPIHASTQMSVHNLQGVLELQELGFSRVVLSRELSIEEIEYICENSNIEIECFIHGALCISYSGQCLFSSMIGGRSGNRGKCAQSCRLPYELIENEKTTLDKGYLLSPRDLCSLDYLPRLINCGVKSLKVEGRMKSPEYVATVTRIYRKYINLAKSNKPYKINEQDRKDLMQVFNRGNFSSGHLNPHANKNLIFSEKPNNMGLFLGHVAKYNPSKGLITLNLNEPIEIGDTIALEKETGTYTISELMTKNTNIKTANPNDFVTIGRMKGNIKVGDKIYKMSSKQLTTLAYSSFENDIQTKKIPLNCEIKIVKNSPISIHVSSACDLEIYRKLDIYCEIDAIPTDSIKHPLEKEKVISQITKTNNTPYFFKNIKIKLDENTFLPNIKALNELRRTALTLVEDFAKSKIQRATNKEFENMNYYNKTNQEKSISLLLNKINLNEDYTSLQGINNIYIPLKFFTQKKYEQIINDLINKFNLYIYLPTIIKSNYRNLLAANIEKTINTYNIKGFILSNISNFKFLKDFNTENFEFIANYTFNIFNQRTLAELDKLGINKFTISPELDKSTIDKFLEISNQELICYGRTPLMNMNYCPLGKSNRCYPECTMKCNTNNNYYLKDRLNLKFPIEPDNIQTVSTLYNSKITSIAPNDFENITSLRIDILEENISEIQQIIDTVNKGEKLKGTQYTNANLNREI
jgi:putative protease